MEKKCPHHPNGVLCRNRRKETVQEQTPRGHNCGRLNSCKVGRMKIIVSPTTGGEEELCVSQQETVRGLKQALARRYRIAPVRINLLHKERVLKDGTLQENEVAEGSRLVLCPNMESGTSSSHAEHSVMQALKNLSDAQVHDFLSGRSPLTLAIRLGEHLMFVQLQLSTSPNRSLSVQPTPSSLSPSPSPSTPTPPASPTTRSAPSAPAGRHADDDVRPRLANQLSLLEASHNLTEKLRELTRLTQQALQVGAQRPGVAAPSMPLTPPPSPPPSPGAVINSMQHMGRGIYSGTFSGTLDPRLQDRSGQPRRDVNTILHILHDLLVAQPASHIAPRPHSQHRHHPYHSRKSPSPGSPLPGRGEDMVMRHKVEQVQHMLEQRRQRRLARRQNQRPYPSSEALSHASLLQSSSTSFIFPEPGAPGHVSPAANTAATTPATTTTTAAANHAENVETSNYRKPNMEQETVAV